MQQYDEERIKALNSFMNEVLEKQEHFDKKTAMRYYEHVLLEAEKFKDAEFERQESKIVSLMSSPHQRQQRNLGGTRIQFKDNNCHHCGKDMAATRKAEHMALCGSCWYGWKHDPICLDCGLMDPPRRTPLHTDKFSRCTKCHESWVDRTTDCQYGLK